MEIEKQRISAEWGFKVLYPVINIQNKMKIQYIYVDSESISGATENSDAVLFFNVDTPLLEDQKMCIDDPRLVLNKLKLFKDIDPSEIKMSLELRDNEVIRLNIQHKRIRTRISLVKPSLYTSIKPREENLDNFSEESSFTINSELKKRIVEAQQSVRTISGIDPTITIIDVNDNETILEFSDVSGDTVEMVLDHHVKIYGTTKKYKLQPLLNLISLINNKQEIKITVGEKGIMKAEFDQFVLYILPEA